MLIDALIIVSVSIMPLINTSTIAHFINDVEAEEFGRGPNVIVMSQLILELSKHLSAHQMFHVLMGIIKFRHRQELNLTYKT